MAVVYQQIGREVSRSSISEAARAISGVRKDEQRRIGRGEGGEDVSERQREHEESIGELKRHAFRRGGGDAMKRFMYLEIVRGGKKRDGGVEGWVGEQRSGDLRVDEPFRCGFRFRVRVCEVGGDGESGARSGCFHGGFFFPLFHFLLFSLYSILVQSD